MGAAGIDVELYQDASAKWTTILDEDLGLLPDKTFADFIVDGDFEEWDYQSWVDRFMEEIVLPVRPG